MNNFSCSSYSEYKQNNNNDQYKNEKYLQYGDHRVKLNKQLVSRKDANLPARTQGKAKGISRALCLRNLVFGKIIISKQFRRVAASSE